MKFEKILEIVLVIFIFILGFGAKAFELNNLGNMDLVGPDPYLFYRYAKELYIYGKIIQPDCLRYYPVCWGLDKYNLIAYFGYLNILALSNPFYYSLINSLLLIFNIVPKATNFFDFGIHTTVPILFCLSSIIFYFIARTLFRNRLYAFLVTLFFIVTPLLTFRITIFEKEAIATPMILLSFLFYILALKNNKEYSIKHSLFFLTITVAISYISLLYISQEIFPIVSSFIIMLFSLIYGIKFGFTREIFYTLSGAFTILAMKSWGGWIIIPLVIGIFETVRFLIGKYDIKYYHFLVYMPTLVMFYGPSPSILFSTRTILPLTPLVLIIFKIILERIKVFDYIKINLIREHKELFTFSLLVIIGLPILLDKVLYLASNPWTERFASSVAEQQPSTPEQFLNSLTNLGFALSALGLFYLLRNKKDVINTLTSAILSLLFLYITVLTEYHILYSWLAFFVILGYIVLFSKNIESTKLWVLIASLLTFVIGDYINRLIFYVGYTFPLLVGYSIFILDDLINKIKEKISEQTKEYLIILLFLLSATAGMSIYFSLIKLWIFLLPVFIFISIVLYIFILNRKIDFSEAIKAGILSIILFGLPGVKGFFLYYLNTYFIGGTEHYLIESLQWVKNNTEKDAIFSFWWDYGYYVQTIANRTTWLDGGNNIVYWNHLMGRYGLCGNETEALELFYVHSTYNFNTFKILELFNRNSVFYKIYKKLNLTKNDLKVIEGLKNRLKDRWINLLFELNETDLEVIKSKYNLKSKEVKVLLKLLKMKYTRPSYLLIHPTDIGKFYQFSKLGSNSWYDKHSWILPFIATIITDLDSYKKSAWPPHVAKILGKYVIVTFADNNTLTYLGDFMLDEDLYINGTKIPRCIPEMGITNCGRIKAIIIVFNKPIVREKGLKKELIYENIVADNIKEAYVIVSYRGKSYRLKLGCLHYYGGSVNNIAIYKRLSWKDANYNGCLYIAPFANLYQQGFNESLFSYGFFISQKAMKYLWIKLYFFGEGKYFREIFDYFRYKYGFSILEYDNQPLKIWKVEFPENFTVPEYKYCLYLATNTNEINKCAKLYRLPKYKSLWDV